MKTYKIPVSWEVCATLNIEAKSLQEAIDIANNEELGLPECEYVDGSFTIDMGDGQILADMYPDEDFTLL